MHFVARTEVKDVSSAHIFARGEFQLDGARDWLLSFSQCVQTQKTLLLGLFCDGDNRHLQSHTNRRVPNPEKFLYKMDGKRKIEEKKLF